MADDERRAEIEAIQRVLEDADLHMHMRMDSMPLKGDPAEEVAEDVLAALDRLRDARGDDEGQFFVCDKCGERLPGDVAIEHYCRSSQGEDHEAGIEAARLKLPSAWRHDGTVDEGEALARVMVAAYLSRVSAPKADENQEAR
jgi:hypothetical protein